MRRFSLPALCALLVLALTWAGQGAFALCLGVVAGAGFLLSGMTRGGSLGNARGFGQTAADWNVRVGALLALIGIGAALLGHEPPFAPAGRGLLTAGQGALCLLVWYTEYHRPSKSG